MPQFAGETYKDFLRSDSKQHLANFFGFDEKWKSYPQIRENSYILSCDDSGTPCFPISQYYEILEVIRTTQDKERSAFFEKYLNTRVSLYFSHRRGECVALRGESYFRNFAETPHLKSVIRGDLIQDIEILNEIVRSQESTSLPSTFILLVLDHIKNNIFRVMYAYLEESLFSTYPFDYHTWIWLDLQAKSVWEMYLGSVLGLPGVEIFQINPNPLVELMDNLQMDNLHKIKELDSVKTLSKFCYTVYANSSNDESFDCCIPLLYGGIEIPYALYSWGTMVSEKGSLFSSISPVIFSLNRVLKNKISPESFDSRGIIDLSQITLPSIQEEIENSDRTLIVDNSFATGYSARLVYESLKNKYISSVYIAVPEIYLEGLQMLYHNKGYWKGKDLYLSYQYLYCSPVGNYTTCFGKKDESRVVNRVHQILGDTKYAPMRGYDFDNTIAHSSSLHRYGFNFAIAQLTGETWDVKQLAPKNKGLSWIQAAYNIAHELQKQGCQLNGLSKRDFAHRLCREKEKYINYSKESLSLIPSVIQDVLAYSVSDIQVIISNNRLLWVKTVLQYHNMLQFFQYLICEDKAYCTLTNDTIPLSGKPKPYTHGFMEASNYFNLPKLSVFYGDSVETDQTFAQSVGAQFHLIR